MGKNVITADAKTTAAKEKNLLALELSEIKEISELIFKKLEKKIRDVETLEAKVDKKVALLQQLMQQTAGNTPPSAVEASLDGKITALKDMIRRSETAGSQGLAALEAAMGKKLAACQHMVEQSETARSRAFAALEATVDKKALAALEAAMERKLAAFQQMLDQSETTRSRALASLETTVNNKLSAMEGLVRNEQALQNKIEEVASREPALDKKAALLDRMIQRAGVLEQKIQNVESLEVSIDKKLGALELLGRRAETIKSHWGGVGRHHEIFALCQKGLSSAEIAEALDMPQGEVDLTLELNTQQA
jgi:DNA repair exonuclease SbcCD ATPase subunit